MATMRESLDSWIRDNYSLCRFPADSRLAMEEPPKTEESPIDPSLYWGLPRGWFQAKPITAEESPAIAIHSDILRFLRQFSEDWNATIKILSPPPEEEPPARRKPFYEEPTEAVTIPSEISRMVGRFSKKYDVEVNLMITGEVDTIYYWPWDRTVNISQYLLLIVAQNPREGMKTLKYMVAHELAHALFAQKGITFRLSSRREAAADALAQEYTGVNREFAYFYHYVISKMMPPVKPYPFPPEMIEQISET